jgi:putative transposase
VYHVINRAKGRLRLFKKDEDYAAFERMIVLAQQKHPIGLLGWCLMGDHWHFVVKPKKDGDLSRFFGYLCLLHVTRRRTGHVYQGRFKSFMIQEDQHLLGVMRYVDRAPIRANLVKRAQDWRFGGLHAQRAGPKELRAALSDWPVERPRNWITDVNRPQNEAEEAAIDNAIKRSCPLGDTGWVSSMVKRYDLQTTLRPRGRQPGWRKAKPKPAKSKKK